VEKRYGTSDIARLCGVAASTVAKWIDDGRLPAHTTGGGHRRVTRGDLLAFMEARRFPVPQELGRQAPVVLVVEDDDSDRALAVRAVRKACPSAEAWEAAGGFEAGQKAARLRPDLVLLDLHLTSAHGHQVCELIRADPALKGTRILAMSGRDGDEVAAAALAHGADGFVSKNAGWDELSRRVNEFLGGRFKADAPARTLP
jgi:excisionase family DNA binding protein